MRRCKRARGSADFSHRIAKALNAHGYTSESGRIKRIVGGDVITTREERDVFALVGMAYVEPEARDS